YEAASAKIKAEYEGKLSARDAQLAIKLRDEALFEAWVDLGVSKNFHDDVQLWGEKAFEVKDGKLTPIGHAFETVEKWLKDKVSKKKEWWGESTGGDTQVSSGVRTSTKTKSQMSMEEKSRYISKYGREAYEKL